MRQAQKWAYRRRRTHLKHPKQIPHAWKTLAVCGRMVRTVDTNIENVNCILCTDTLKRKL
jgi:hypothetical protein